MSDATIAGKEITFDLEKITISEYRSFAKGSITNEEDDELLVRVTGEPVEWIRSLSHSNFRRLLGAFFDKAKSPLDNPN